MNGMDNGTTLVNGHRDTAGMTPAVRPLVLANLPAVWPPDAGHGEAPAAPPEPSPETVTDDTGPARNIRDYPWPLLVIAAPAAVAIWSGWVGLGEMCGFGPIHPLPGIADSFTINTAITLPVGVEAYGAYALAVWLGAKKIGPKTRRWARVSAVGALALGCLGQVAFHLLSAAHWVQAPWPVVTAVSCLPVVSLALAAALAHMIRADVCDDAEGDPDGGEMPSEATTETTPEVSPEPPVQVTPESVSGQVPSQPEPPAPVVSQVRSRRKTQVKSARISDADLKDEIRSALADGTAPSVNAVAKTLGRGRDRVRPLLEEVRREGQELR
jgi:hypothetical protein